MRGQTSLEYLLLTAGVVVVAVTAGYYVASGVSSISSQIQAVDFTKPAVVITYPPQNTTLYTTSVTVEFNVSDDRGLSSITIDCDSDGTPEKTIKNPSNPYSGTYTCTYPSPGSYTIKIVAKDTTGNTSVATRFFTISLNKSPSITITSPSNGQTFSTSSFPYSVTIKWSASDPDGDPLVFSIDCENDGTPDASTSSTTYSCTYNSEGTYTTRVVASDGKGGSASDTVTFKIIHTPSCTDECSPSGKTETRCNGAALEQRTCGDYNTADPCLEWSDWTVIESCSTQCVDCCTDSDCPSGQVCQNNQCVTPPQCTSDSDCPSDGWYNYGNTSGCGDDPTAEYRDYYCNNGTCDYTVTQTKDCDSQDECNGVCENGVFYSYKDYYVSSSGTCEFNYGPVVEPDDSEDACTCAGGEWVQMTTYTYPPQYHCCGDDAGEQTSSDCAADQTLDPNKCSCVCTNQCDPSNYPQCSNKTYYECKDTDNDGCYELVTTSVDCCTDSDCPSGQVCQNNQCVTPSCTDECDPSNYPKCENTTYYECKDTNNDGCYELVTTSVDCCTNDDCKGRSPTEPYCYNHQCVECYSDSHCNDRDGWYTTSDGHEYRDYYCDASTFTCKYRVTDSCSNECTYGDLDNQSCTLLCTPPDLSPYEVKVYWYEIKVCVDDADDDPCTEWKTKCEATCPT